MKLQNHVAVVTGASSGIGQAIAVAYAREGAAVAIAYHGDAADAEDTRKAVEAEGGRSIVVGIDVGAEADVERLFAETTAKLGTPTLLVNSAGIDASGIKVRDMPLETWEATIRTNLTGPFLTCRAFLKGLGGKPGKIINISSVHQELPRAGAAEYCASKGGMRMLTRCLSLEGAPDGVTVNNIAPGMVLTPMNQEAIDDPKVLAEQVASIPLKRAAKPEEVAELAVYLASKAADYASGSTFTLDGGLEMNVGKALEARPMTGFAVEVMEPLRLNCRGRLTNMYLLSPFVWEQDGRFHLLLRAVPRRDDEPRLKMAEIWYGQGDDGLTFDMDEGPTLFPGPEEVDLDGCEDPTVVVQGGALHVWYTGWNQKQETGRLVHAVGPDPRTFEKRETALDSSKAFANPKEATVALAADDRWRMFFEFARDEASMIGVAVAGSLDGPWKPMDSALERRTARWDAWHMSSGPVIDAGGDAPVMFYNGATQDAHWRIGWAKFDAAFETVVERCGKPLITPDAVDSDKTDIAFAASAIERLDEIWLYYSISDQQILRARVQRL